MLVRVVVTSKALKQANCCAMTIFNLIFNYLNPLQWIMTNVFYSYKFVKHKTFLSS